MTRTIVPAAFLAIGVSLVACGTQGNKPEVKAQRLDTQANPAGADVQSASGHVEFIGRLGGDNRYSFIASKRFNPETGETTISGEIQYQSLRADGTFVDAHGTVICLENVGNTARFGAVGDHSFGFPEGTPNLGYFTVVDNGEGSDGPPDMASNLFGGSEETVLQHCATGHVPAPAVFPILRGNVQVRP